MMITLNQQTENKIYIYIYCYITQPYYSADVTVSIYPCIVWQYSCRNLAQVHSSELGSTMLPLALCRVSLGLEKDDSPPSLQYSMRYPSSPPAPIFSGANHFSEHVVSVTSSTVSFVGSLVGAERKRKEKQELIQKTSKLHSKKIAKRSHRLAWMVWSWDWEPTFRFHWPRKLSSRTECLQSCAWPRMLSSHKCQS